MCAEASDLRPWPVAAPGEAIARFRQTKVDYLEAFVKLAREGRAPEGTVVSVLTGHGLKDPDVILNRTQLPDPVPATFDALTRAMKESS